MPGLGRAELRALTGGALFLVVWFFGGGFALGAQAPEKKKDLRMAARIGDQVVTLLEVEQALAVQLARLEEQKHHLMESKVEEMIEGRLLGQEAKRRGFTVEALLKAEVFSKVPEVTDTEVVTFMTQNKARLKGETADLLPKVREHLMNEKVVSLQRAYVAGLRRKTRVEVFLKEPEPTRISVKVEGAFVKGPKDAPVTIVEFSDFQCPFCRTVVATVKEVMRQFAGQVKWVYRDFPLSSLHPQAQKAAEAARCAGEQGKFWEYHDLLFDSQAQWTATDFKRFADKLKLETKSFGLCLDSGKHEVAVQSDIDDGARLGITGTPTFFINGRVLVGAQPLENFKKIIGAELRKKPD